MEPDEKRSIKKRILWTTIAIALLTVVLFMAGTSSWFAKGFILPRIAASKGFSATADRISISLFDGVSISGFAASRSEDALDVSAENIQIDAHLLNLIGGQPNAQAVTVSGLRVHIVLEQESPVSTSTPRPATSPPSSGWIPSIENLTIEDASGSLVYLYNGVTNRVVAANRVSLQITDLRPGVETKIDIAGQTSISSIGGDEAGSIEAEVSQHLTLQMGAQLMPTSAILEGAVATRRAEGFFAELADIRISTAARIEQDRIRQARLSFSKDMADLGSVTVDGPVNLTQKEARLRVATTPLSGAVIDLFTRPLGIETTTDGLTINGNIEFARGGNFITLNQKIEAARLGFRNTRGTIAPLDLNAELLLNYNRLENSLLVRTLNLNAEQGGHQVVSTSMDRPMNIAFGKDRPGFKEATFSTSIDDLELSDWSLIAGQWLGSGRLTAIMEATAARDGALITATTKGSLTALAASGLPGLHDGLLTFNVSSRFENLRTFEVSRLDYVISDPSGEIVSGDVGGQVDLQTGGFSIRAAARAQLGPAFKVLDLPAVRFENGSATISQLLKTDGDKSQLNGSVFISDADGVVFGRRLDDHRINIQNQIETAADTVRLRQIGFEFGQSTANGGKLNLEATLSSDLGTGSVRFRTIGLNRVALSPFMNEDSTLSPIDRFVINGDTTVQLLGGRVSAVRSDMRINDLALSGGPSLSVEVTADAQLNQELIRLNELAATWQNSNDDQFAVSKLILAGGVPSSASTNAAALELRGGICDFSKPVEMARAYFSAIGKSTPDAGGSDRPPTDSGNNVSLRERFADHGALNVNIDRAIYQDLTSTNLIARLDYESGMVILRPLELDLNGTTTTASGQVSLDLPDAFQFRFEGKELPLSPLISSLSLGSPQPADATVSMSLDLVSSGDTTSNRLPISGTVNASFQNADYELANPKYAPLVDPIMALLKVPSLRASSVTDAELKLSAENGISNLQSVEFSNELFTVATKGTVSLNAKWEDSALDLPLEMALSNQVADRIGMEPNPQGGYVPLPRFASLAGTIGKPYTRIDNKAGLLRLGLEVFQDEIPKKYRDEIKIVEDVLKVLDPASTPKNGEFNPLDLFRKVLPR